MYLETLYKRTELNHMIRKYFLWIYRVIFFSKVIQKKEANLLVYELERFFTYNL